MPPTPESHETSTTRAARDCSSMSQSKRRACRTTPANIGHLGGPQSIRTPILNSTHMPLATCRWGCGSTRPSVDRCLFLGPHGSGSHLDEASIVQCNRMGGHFNRLSLALHSLLDRDLKIVNGPPPDAAHAFGQTLKEFMVSRYKLDTERSQNALQRRGRGLLARAKLKIPPTCFPQLAVQVLIAGRVMNKEG